MVMSSEDSINRKKIVSRYRSLVRSFGSEVTHEELVLLRKAFNLALDVSRSKLSGFSEPYLLQPLAIAKIVAHEMHIGIQAAISSLLYVFVRDNYLPKSEIKELFGTKISQVIEGLTRISSIDSRDTSLQSENFRRLILSMATDIRVIIIKLAERLEILRNLDDFPVEKQIKIASETLELYAPLAHRLGLYSVKTEMEDIALRFTEPESYNNLVRKLQDTKERRNRFIREFIKPIKASLEKENFEFEIKGRPKSVYSIWRKMKKQGVAFEEIYDKFAIRIILNSALDKEKSDCWRVYSIVTDFYQPNPLRLRDWISVPKSNGYESLHTTVVVPGGQWVEVQIRTSRMDDIAELGFAAHWKYKGIKSDEGSDEWLNQVRSMLDAPETDNADFIDDFKLSLYNKEIFVFTPKGDLKKLPAGSTVLDFAFDIHSNLGVCCMGAKVNNKNVPIRYVLQNGDTVEILTSKNQKPKEDWLDFVVTSKAKTKIKIALKEEILKEAEIGKETLRRRLRNWKISLPDKVMTKILKVYKLKTAVDLYYKIAVEEIDPSEIKQIILAIEQPNDSEPEKIDDSLVDKLSKTQSQPKQDDFLIIDEKVSNLDYQLSKCCSPIFGDPIFGFVTINEGIKIHRTNCPNARQLLTKFGYRVVKAKWTNSKGDAFFQGVIKVTGYDEMGIVSNISDVISKDLKVNLRSLNVETADGMFEGLIKVYIKNIEHLNVLINKIQRVKGVLKVSRVENVL
jgi:GTP diphosphokinase / guanosine-3',5'-bis(diphosphate) 3'-diphosphatase